MLLTLVMSKSFVLFKTFTKWIKKTLNVIGLLVWWKMHYSTIYCTQLINFILILIFNWFFSNAQFLFSTSIFSINLVSQVTLRSNGTDILYGCHLLRSLYNILYFLWLYNEFFNILYNILNIAELDCCQIIILSVFVPSIHA